MNGEVRTASNWYRWLWLSPLLTVPTQLVLAVMIPQALMAPGDRMEPKAYFIAALLAIPAAGLWHLVLLAPALDGQGEFVRWHGRQALLIGGMRTLAALAFAALSLGPLGYFCQIVLWFMTALL